jgi:Domain of unknown function (DUF4331)
VLAAGVCSSPGVRRPPRSDSPTAIADGRINLCDLFVFPGVPGTTTLILTVNPDAGRSSAATFQPDALYEFVVASDGGTHEDIAFRVTFARPDNAGNQQMPVLRTGGAAARHGTEGTLLGQGHTGEVFPLDAGGWRGLDWPRIPPPPTGSPWPDSSPGSQQSSTNPASSRPHQAISSPAVM